MPALAICGATDHWNHREDPDYDSQPGALFRLMTKAQQQVLFEDTASSIRGAPEEIPERHIANHTKADPAYGAGIRAALEALKPALAAAK